MDVPVSGQLETNNADVLLQAARDGLGLVLIPAWMVSDCLAIAVWSVYWTITP